MNVENKAIPLYMHIRQISKEFGIPERYLRDLDHKNQLPGFKTGNRTNVNVPMLLAQLEKECERGASV